MPEKVCLFRCFVFTDFLVGQLAPEYPNWHNLSDTGGTICSAVDRRKGYLELLANNTGFIQTNVYVTYNVLTKIASLFYWDARHTENEHCTLIKLLIRWSTSQPFSEKLTIQKITIL